MKHTLCSLFVTCSLLLLSSCKESTYSPLMEALADGKTLYRIVIGNGIERVNRGETFFEKTNRNPGGFQLPDDSVVSNSTEYFKWLFDENQYNTPHWKPIVDDFDYELLGGKLLGMTVDPKHLTPENNLWIILERVVPEIDDNIPVLLTRNLEPLLLGKSCASKRGRERLKIDDKYYVIARKNGVVRRGLLHNLTMYDLFDPVCDASCEYATNRNATLVYLTPKTRITIYYQKGGLKR